MVPQPSRPSGVAGAPAYLENQRDQSRDVAAPFVRCWSGFLWRTVVWPQAELTSMDVQLMGAHSAP